MKKGILWGSLWGMYTSLISLLTAGAVIYTVTLFAGESFKDSFDSYGLVFALAVIDLIIVAALSAALTAVIRRRSDAGPVLLDLGRTPNNDLAFPVALVLLATLPIFVGVLGNSLRQDDPFLFSPFGFSLIVIHLVLVAISIVMLTVSRRQIREGGFKISWRLTKWDEIESYRWKDETGNTLILRQAHSKKFGGAHAGGKASSPLRIFGDIMNSDGSINLSIPAEYKESVDQLFQKFCGSRANIEEIST